jgi:lambda family phage portal protein
MSMLKTDSSPLWLPSSYVGRELQRLARQDKELQRLYEAASNDQFRPVVNNQASGDATMNSAGSRLRQLARHLEENHDIVVSLFDDLLNNVVGAGASVTPMVRRPDGTLADDVNSRLYDDFIDWGDYPDVTGEFGFEQVERQVARHLFRDGEIFVRPVFSQRFNYRTRVPYALELTEADYCPFDANSNDGRITHGIERNQWGAPSYYYFHREHPGNFVNASMAVSLDQLRRVSASGVHHLKFTRRVNQARGVPIIHAVINRLRDLKDYEESERIAAKVAADFTFAITKNSEFGAGPSPVNTAGNRSFEMSAGMGFELLPGEDVKTIQSNRPNTALADFRAAMVRAVAGGTGTRYSAIAKDYNGTYSAQRQELVEGAVSYRVHFAHLVRRFYRPIWRDFVRAEVLAGRIDLAGIDVESLFRCDFRAPALPWIDPQKEAKAWRELVDAKLESRSEIMRQRGRDPRKVIEEMLQEADNALFASAIEQAGDLVTDEETDENDDDEQQAVA